MRTIFAVPLLLLALLVARGECLELKNGRASYGPMLGATRTSTKYLPGDFVYYNFDIDKLTTKGKGIAVYQQTLELVSDKKGVIYKQAPPASELPLMIGGSVPGTVQLHLPTDTAPGAYKIKVTVADRAATPAVTKELVYEFDLLKPAFGLVGASAPAVIFSGQDLPVGFAVVGMKRDDKTKMPDVEMVMRVLDQNGKPAFASPFTSNLKDVHAPEAGVDITKPNVVVPVGSTFAMTHPGKYTIEIRATDKLAKDESVIALPVTVLDPSPYFKTSK